MCIISFFLWWQRCLKFPALCWVVLGIKFYLGHATCLHVGWALTGKAGQGHLWVRLWGQPCLSCAATLECGSEVRLGPSSHTHWARRRWLVPQCEIKILFPDGVNGWWTTDVYLGCFWHPDCEEFPGIPASYPQLPPLRGNPDISSCKMECLSLYMDL